MPDSTRNRRWSMVMPRTYRSSGLLLTSVVVGSLATPPSAFAESTVDSLYVFKGQPDGSEPLGGLTADKSGNFFGTTQFGGPYGVGSVFKLSPNGKGGWAYQLIYGLGADSQDQAFPLGPVAVDGRGHLYVTTVLDAVVGNGGVFELAPDHAGKYRLGKTFLFNGNGSNTRNGDGAKPWDGLVADRAGNLFGTTSVGGDGHGIPNPNNGYGTIFELTSTGDGWKETTLHRFEYGTADGGYPHAGLAIDREGDLYGVESYGGNGFGTVFTLHKEGASWTKAIIYSFVPGDGGSPNDVTPVLDSAGNLYGTTVGNVDHQIVSTVFKLIRPKKNSTPQKDWPHQILHWFDQASDGDNPQQLYLDKTGVIYGTTSEGGKSPCFCGTIYSLTPATTGSWTWTLLWTFRGGKDGNAGFGPLAAGSDGMLYGATIYGPNKHNNPFGNGVLFSFTK